MRRQGLAAQKWLHAIATGMTCLVSAVATSAAGAGEVHVELELVLAVDASGSVSGSEFELQLRGLADAFRDPAVVAAVDHLAPNGMAVALFQWSSPGQQVVAVDWSVVSDAASAAAMADRIESSGRLILGETAIEGGLAFAVNLLASNHFVGRRRVVDVSGDGQANWGPDPDAVRDRAVADGITINALAVVNEQARLEDYYRAHVIGGSGAFVLSAADYTDYARAIRLKLLQEIGQDVLSSQDGWERRQAAVLPRSE